jgi:hypothetical protein
MTTPGTQREVSPESMGKTASSAVGSPPDAKPASHCTTGNTADQNRLKPCTGKPFELSNELDFESQKGNPSLMLYITVQVRDVEAEHRRFMSMGVWEGAAPVTLGTVARISFIRDPDGNFIEISQRASLTGPIPG